MLSNDNNTTDLTEEIVYLGRLTKGPKSQLVNFIILLYKYYLYTVEEGCEQSMPFGI